MLLKVAIGVVKSQDVFLKCNKMTLITIFYEKIVALLKLDIRFSIQRAPRN